jgi:hypothetical protein
MRKYMATIQEAAAQYLRDEELTKNRIMDGIRKRIDDEIIKDLFLTVVKANPPEDEQDEFNGLVGLAMTPRSEPEALEASARSTQPRRFNLGSARPRRG